MKNLEDALSYGTSAEIDAEAAKFGLVRTISQDACENCKAGIDSGYDHRECMTLAPLSDLLVIAGVA